MSNLRRKIAAAAVGAGLCVLAAGFSLCEAKEFSSGPISINVPDEIVDLCVIETEDNGIDIRDRQAMENKWGGFVEHIRLYDDPAGYRMNPSFRFLGVISFDDGTVKNVVAYYPTDVQYDPRVEDSTYPKVYEAREAIEASLSCSGGGTFIPAAEVDTTSVYAPILEEVIGAISERKDREALEEMGLSGVYAYTYDLEGDPLDRIGYAFTDLDHDGYKELILGSLDDPSVYDMFVNVNGEAFDLLTSGERSMYSICGREEKPEYLRLSASGSAAESFFEFYLLNGPELVQQVRFIYDGTEDPDAPWFISHWEDEKEPLGEEDWNERLERYNNPITPDYNPLSSFAG